LSPSCERFIGEFLEVAEANPIFIEKFGRPQAIIKWKNENQKKKNDFPHKIGAIHLHLFMQATTACISKVHQPQSGLGERSSFGLGWTAPVTLLLVPIH
jgi:hypothetical protein